MKGEETRIKTREGEEGDGEEKEDATRRLTSPRLTAAPD